MNGTTIVVGAGPAGLTSALELVEAGAGVDVIERDSSLVGGLSRTVEYRGFRFDIGGHRFFSKNDEITALWRSVLGERLRPRKRQSRIYYRGRFFRYPLDLADAFGNLGPAESMRCFASWVAARCRRRRVPRSFEDWVTDAFGRRLYGMFFATYTEKVWGVPGSAISADWAAQRINGLSGATIVRSILGAGRGSSPAAKTLVDNFLYPDLGPGEMWDTVASVVRGRGGRIHLGETVTRIERAAGGRLRVTTTGPEGPRSREASHVISTMPLGALVTSLDPPAPEPVRAAANALRHRDFLLVALIVDRADVFPDQWMYVHDPSVRVARIQNFKNWSPHMVPDERFTSLGLEYFCDHDDPLWRLRDDELVALARGEAAAIGLVDPAEIVDATVVRQRRAYPVYDHAYAANVGLIREFLAAEAPNLHPAGRNGMHKYDNQDHAMLTGRLAARNVLGEAWDPWRVNVDAEYLESDEDPATGRIAPRLAAGAGR